MYKPILFLFSLDINVTKESKNTLESSTEKAFIEYLYIIIPYNDMRGMQSGTGYNDDKRVHTIQEISNLHPQY